MDVFNITYCYIRAQFAYFSHAPMGYPAEFADAACEIYSFRVY